MPKALISFNRDFQIWKYTVGHSQLLLRSTKTPACPSRVDVFFKNVGALNLPSNFSGLSIVECSITEAAKVNTFDPLSIAQGQRKLFFVRGSAFEGYVIAGVVVWHEDDREYHEPSFFSKDNDI